MVYLVQVIWHHLPFLGSARRPATCLYRAIQMEHKVADATKTCVFLKPLSTSSNAPTRPLRTHVRTLVLGHFRPIIRSPATGSTSSSLTITAGAAASPVPVALVLHWSPTAFQLRFFVLGVLNICVRAAAGHPNLAKNRIIWFIAWQYLLPVKPTVVWFPLRRWFEPLVLLVEPRQRTWCTCCTSAHPD